MSDLWRAGVSVPYPIAFADDVFDLEYIGVVGDGGTATVHGAPVAGPARGSHSTSCSPVCARSPTAGITHGDLSAYNLLWWEDRLWFIDFPQSIDLAANLQGIDFLHRDVLNVCGWFERRGFDVDAEEVFADLLSFL